MYYFTVPLSFGSFVVEEPGNALTYTTNPFSIFLISTDVPATL